MIVWALVMSLWSGHVGPAQRTPLDILSTQHECEREKRTYHNHGQGGLLCVPVIRALAILVLLSGAAHAACTVDRAGGPPVMLMNVPDADCEAFKAAMKAGEPVAHFFVDQMPHEKGMMTGHREHGEKK